MRSLVLGIVIGWIACCFWQPPPIRVAHTIRPVVLTNINRGVDLVILATPQEAKQLTAR